MENRPDEQRAAVSTRTMEIAVAGILMLIGGVVAFDSYRLGARWADDGPQSGYFPFYIGLIIVVSSAITLLKALRGGPGLPFVERGALRRVLAVLVPAIVYVLAIELIGIYVSSAVYIAGFMVWLGGYPPLRSISLGCAVSVVFFLMFEVWFKVPLYKGVFDPLAFLGY